MAISIERNRPVLYKRCDQEGGEMQETAADLTGAWRLTLQFPEQMVVSAMLFVKRTGARLEGTYWGRMGETSVAGTVTGDGFVLDGADQRRTIHINGSVETENELAGSIQIVAKQMLGSQGIKERRQTRGANAPLGVKRVPESGIAPRRGMQAENRSEARGFGDPKPAESALRFVAGPNGGDEDSVLSEEEAVEALAETSRSLGGGMPPRSTGNVLQFRATFVATRL
jgi:hypothetical protein